MNNVKLILAGAGVLAVLATAFVMAKSDASEPKAPVPVKMAPSLTVTAAIAQKVQWPDIIKASGSVAAWQEAVIGSEIGGQRLVEVLANVGDAVKKGQVLARYNADTLKTEQAELRADWLLAESNRKRAEKLRGIGAQSAEQAETFISQAAVAKARLDAKNLQIRYTEIVAPDDGSISSRTATLGAVGSVGQELFRLIRQDRLEWRGELSAAQLDRAVPGQPVEVTLPDGSLAEATIRQTAPSLDAQSRMGIVYADIKAGSHARAGMYGEGRIALDNTPALVVPAKSVVIRDGHSYVFKLSHDAAVKVRQQEVATGRSKGDAIEILSGLAENETVAVQGAGFLNDGDTVRVAAASEQAAE